MKPDLSAITLICYENRDHASALDLMAAMTRLAHFGNARLLNWFHGWQQFNYWENYETWKYVTTSHMLCIHLDGYIVNPELWDPAWLEYDYIGAPWPEDLNKDRVGNGGFCLKSRRLLNRIAEIPWQDFPGDVLVCSVFREQLIAEGFKFAPLEVAALFSIENKIPEHQPAKTFGFHGTMNFPAWKA
ncbi:MAG: DUF5672 family protein [Verrucomicrobium sp.]